MRKSKYVLNVDFLEVCYTGSRELVDSLEETTYWEVDNFRLKAPPLEWFRYATLRTSGSFDSGEALG